MPDKLPVDGTIQKLILPPDMITLLSRQGNFMDRADMRIFPASSNEEALNLHREERASLITVHLQREGLDTQKFCSRIRDDHRLSKASVIILCHDEAAALDFGSHCRANAIMIKPVSPDRFTQTVRRLLTIAARTAYRVLLSITVDAAGPRGPFFCRSINMSPSGLLIETEQAVEIGSRVSCSFYLPGRQQIRSACEVVRMEQQPAKSGDRANRFGIRFLDLRPEEKTAIEAFIAEKTAEQRSS